MFKELIQTNEETAREYPELNGAYSAIFRGVSQKQRRTFETRNSETPEFEECFVFEFEVDDPELEAPVLVSRWVRKPKRLAHPGENGKVTNLYKTLASLYGVSVMTNEQLAGAEEFVQSAVGREYQLTLQTKPNGWIEIVHIAPSRRKAKKEEKELPF